MRNAGTGEEQNNNAVPLIRRCFIDFRTDSETSVVSCVDDKDPLVIPRVMDLSQRENLAGACA